MKYPKIHPKQKTKKYKIKFEQHLIVNKNPDIKVRKEGKIIEIFNDFIKCLSNVHSPYLFLILYRLVHQGNPFIFTFDRNTRFFRWCSSL